MENKKELKLINMEDVEIQDVEWMLYPYIPYGKITIIQGDPGEGKTTFALQLIGSLTRGEGLLTGKKKDPINVIYQTAEDGLGDTIKPRLADAGAICSRVLVIDEGDNPLSMSDDRLEQAIIETKARLIVLDPIQGYLGSGVDMHRANEIRPIMTHCTKLAEKYNCSFILIGHMNKCSQGKSSYRGLGSIDFHAAARSVLVIGRIKDEPEIRAVCQIKSSLAPEGNAIAFRLDKEEGFSWIGEYDIDVDSLLSGYSSGNNMGKKRKEAKDFITKILSDGPLRSTEIESKAKEEGIKMRTLMNAKSDLNVYVNKKNNKWFWELKGKQLSKNARCLPLKE